MIISKMTKKGQITIPVKFRKKLKSNVVRMSVMEDKLIITPIQDVGGIFQHYAIKDKPIEEVMGLEKESFKNAMEEKHSSNRR